MATRPFTFSDVSRDPAFATLFTWTGLLNTDDGTPAQVPGMGDRAVQIIGTFGAGGTVVWEGSLDGTNYVTLVDVFNVALSLTAAGLRQVAPNTLYIRPRVTAGDGTTNLTAMLLARTDG